MKNNTAVIDPREQSWELFGAFLRDDESRRLLSAASNPISEADKAYMESFFREKEAAHLRMIGKTVACQTKKHLLKTTLPKTLRIAAVFIAVLAVSAGIALAAIPDFRDYVGKLFATTTPKYTELKMIFETTEGNPISIVPESLPELENNTQNQPSAASGKTLVPEDWTGKNILTNLPDSAEIVSVGLDDDSPQVMYKVNPSSPTVWDISYSEYPGDIIIRVDTEGAELSAYIINGSTVTAAVTNNLISLWWNDEDTIFIFHGQHLTLQEALDYVRHIVPAKQISRE